MVKNGDVDFAIATESLHLYDDLLTLPCYQWSRSVIVPHDHPLAQNEQLTIQELAHYPLITYVFGFTGRSKLDQVFYQNHLTPNVVLTAVDTEIIKFYVKRGRVSVLFPPWRLIRRKTVTHCAVLISVIW